MKKKTLVPLIVFLLGMCLVGLIVYKTNAIEKEQKCTTAQLNATTYGERIKNEITNGIEITDVLKEMKRARLICSMIKIVEKFPVMRGITIL